MGEPEEIHVRRRDDVTDAELVGGVEQRDLFLVEYDPAWPSEYAAHEARIRTALGSTAAGVEHIGSTSVPGLAAKPIIDILVTVPDITAEEDYLDQLVAAGYVLRVREPGHRLVRTAQRDVQIHILEVGDPAAAAYLLLRDHLRVDEADRRLYEATKRELLVADWSDMNAYADAKTAVIEEIKTRARSRTAGVRVRTATPADASAIEHVGRETWPSTYAFAGEDYIAHGLRTWWSREAVLRGIETTRTFVAEVAGEVIGMGNIDLRPEQPVIWKLYVLPSHQRTGAGHALMTRLLAEAPAGSEVLLEYTDGNARAAGFYLRHGFVELRRDAPEVDEWPAQVWMVHKPDLR